MYLFILVCFKIDIYNTEVMKWHFFLSIMNTTFVYRFASSFGWIYAPSSSCVSLPMQGGLKTQPILILDFVARN